MSTFETQDLVLASALQARRYWLLDTPGSSGQAEAVTGDDNVTLQEVVPQPAPPGTRPYCRLVLRYQDEAAFLDKQTAYEEGRMLLQPNDYDGCRDATMAQIRHARPKERSEK